MAQLVSGCRRVKDRATEALVLVVSKLWFW